MSTTTDNDIASCVDRDLVDKYLANLRASCTVPESSDWWIREAIRAANLGHAAAIGSRNGDRIYMMRYWLSEPIAKQDGTGWEAEESLLLHNILLPDDCRALHCHPWRFRSTILCGGYVEYLPPPAWSIGDLLGPPPDTNQVLRIKDDTIDHQASDLHAIGQVAKNTWTLVRTWEEERVWGFHEHGKPWETSHAYIRRVREQARS